MRHNIVYGICDKWCPYKFVYWRSITFLPCAFSGRKGFNIPIGLRCIFYFISHCHSLLTSTKFTKHLMLRWEINPHGSQTVNCLNRMNEKWKVKFLESFRFLINAQIKYVKITLQMLQILAIIFLIYKMKKNPHRKFCQHVVDRWTPFTEQRTRHLNLRIMNFIDTH